MPATIEKLPKVVKIDMNTSPCSSASSRPSRLTSCSSRPSGASAARASGARRASVSAAPEVASPRLETSDVADLALAAEQRLRAGERQQHRGAVAAGAVVVDDRP